MKYSKFLYRFEFWFFVLMTISFGVPTSLYCQSETQDIIQYTPPPGWTRAPKDGAMVYSDLNKTSGTFCILTIYSSVASSGSPQKDFAFRWDELLVKQFNVAANPKTETQTNADGWQATAGGTDIEMDGVKAAAILTVFSGFGKTASVLVLVNDQSYLAQADALVAGIKLDKTLAKRSVVVQPTSSDFLDLDPFPDKPHIQAQKPLIGRLRRTITVADLAGKWEIGSASVMEYVSSSTQQYTSSSFGRFKYTIRGDGTYDSDFEGRASNTTIRESDSGTVTLDGGFIILKSRKKPAMRYQFVAYMSQANGTAILSLIYIGESAPLDGKALRANCAHAYGYVSCLNGEEWVRVP